MPISALQFPNGNSVDLPVIEIMVRVREMATEVRKKMLRGLLYSLRSRVVEIAQIVSAPQVS